MQKRKRDWDPPPLLELAIKAINAGMSHEYQAGKFVVLSRQRYEELLSQKEYPNPAEKSGC